MVWTPLRKIWIKAISHHSNCITLTLKNRKLRYHSLCFCKLVLTTIRHKHWACTDWTIESFNKSFLWTFIKICKCLKPLTLNILNFLCLKIIILLIWYIYKYRSFLMCTVSIKESSWYINYILSSPVKYKSGFFSNYCNFYRLKILFCCICKELLNIWRINNNCHTFLRLRYSKFCSVKSFILLRDLIKINYKTICKLTDSYRYTTCTKIVTFLNKLSNLWSSEKSLHLTLCRCITFLYLSSTSLYRLFCMNLRWTCSTATAITSCTSTKKNNNISWVWILSLNCTSWSCCYNSTYLHTFCNIVRVIYFLDITCCKTYLVTIWAISMSCLCNYLSLWKLAMKCVCYWNCRISCTCYTHSLIYICSSWKWISYSSTKTCSSTTKWLYLCWVVVSFILEVNKPFFCLSIYFNWNYYRAGIYLVRFFLII